MARRTFACACSSHLLMQAQTTQTWQISGGDARADKAETEFTTHRSLGRVSVLEIATELLLAFGLPCSLLRLTVGIALRALHFVS